MHKSRQGRFYARVKKMRKKAALGAICAPQAGIIQKIRKLMAFIDRRIEEFCKLEII
jgi:hypothetical protein